MSEWSLGHVEVLLRLVVQCTHLSYRQVNYTLGSVYEWIFQCSKNVIRITVYNIMCVGGMEGPDRQKHTHTQRERTRQFQANDRQIKHMDI